MVKAHRRRGEAPTFHPMSFGGWNDYQEWADHDFIPRPVDDLPGEDTDTTDSADSPEGTDIAAPESESAAAEVVDGEDEPEHNDPADARRARPPSPVPRPSLPPQRTEGPRPARSAWPEHLADDPPDELAPRTTMARPYVRTGGRARSEYDLRLETMLSTTWLGASRRPGAELSSDQEMICRLCQVPTSVAEIAAHLRAPLGVARVLIGDAIDSSFLSIHEVAASTNGRPSLDLMKRVYNGLCKLD